MLLRERVDYRGKFVKKDNGDWEYVILEEKYELRDSILYPGSAELDEIEIEKEPIILGK